MDESSGDELARWERTEGPAVEAGGGGEGKMERIVVSVRLRPLTEEEIERGDPCDWECVNGTTIILNNSLPEKNMPPFAYSFNRVFGCESSTKQVYEEAAKEVALSVVGGINSSIFAYGQTSSGKTYTMNGITEYAVADIYDYIKKHEERAFVLKFSAMEIYNEAVNDLLSTDSTPLRLLDDPDRGIIIEKLTEEMLRDWSHFKELLSICEAHRRIGETSLNEKSSRSHQILRLTIESSAREFLGRDNTSTLVASVNFVDLAGSERASQALSTGARLREGCHINRSLLTLGTLIRKLSKGRNVHMPYRESKLTRILQPSLGGNAKTAIICTICPARSHIEQSKNTLLFASCAKEVVTNARVNVVMSDKALVKHLQKELARLENELKYPGSTSNTGDFEASLREKDARIRKMEKEIEELIQERDLAQSQLEDLLLVTQADRASRPWEEVSCFLTYHATNACEDVLSVSDTSVFAEGLDNGFTRLRFEHGGNSCTDSYQQLLEKPTEQICLSPRISMGNSISLIPYKSCRGTTQESLEDNEELCKDVRCVEINEQSTHKSEEPHSLFTEGSTSTQPLTVDSNRHRDHEPQDVGDRNLGPIGAESPFITLEKQLKIARKTIDNHAKTYRDVSSPWSSHRDLSSSRGLEISRSRSGRATLMDSLSSSSFQAAEQDNCTSPSRFLKDFPERPEGLQRKHIASNYGDEAEVLLGQHSSEHGSREMAYIKTQKELTDDHEKEHSTNEDLGLGATARDVAVDPMLDPLESPSQWPIEFEKKQQEIIELWHACNVSLVHRTYFFLLFKGDPADSIYVEVELRRLSFLKSTFSPGNLDRTATLNGQNINSALSMRKLRHEKEMLYQRMHKRLSPEERESLYMKWGIALDSKQRRLQLARCLWTQTNMEHVRESASVVARLIGLLDPEKALKEMFGLSFTPQQTNRRPYSWRHGISSSSQKKMVVL